MHTRSPARRRTSTAEDLIPEEENAVTISHNGYIKRLPLNTYRSQHRGGRGVSGGSTREDDFIEHFFVCSTHAYLLCFTNQGQLYWLRVFNIEEGSRTASGRSIANVLSLQPDERISSLIPVRDLDAEHSTAEGLHLLMATRRGLVKKTALAEYTRPRAGGLIGISLDEGDTLIGVALVRPGDEVLLCTRSGMAIRFDESNARPMGRNTRRRQGHRAARRRRGGRHGGGRPGRLPADGVRQRLRQADPVRAQHGRAQVDRDGGRSRGSRRSSRLRKTGAAPRRRASETTRSAMYYRKQRRGGKGVRDIRTSERNGPVVGVTAVKESDDVMLITTGGMVNRTHAHEIRIVGRNTQGVRLMGLKEGDRIASLARVAPEAEEDEAAPAEAPVESKHPSPQPPPRSGEGEQEP